MSYIETRLETWAASEGSKAKEAGLLGKVVDEVVQPNAASSAVPPDPQPGDGPPLVEVGDTVSYEEAAGAGSVRRVTIVRGLDDPANGVISDDKPLAIALLGAEVGETVTVGQAPADLDVRVSRIERPDLENAGQPGPSIHEAIDGLELAPYRKWRGEAPDPRSAQLREVAETLLRIVEAEAPVLVERAYQAYIQGSAVRRLGPSVRRTLNRALASLERKKRVSVKRATNASGHQNALVTTPATDATVVREIGPRTLDEVPLPEVSSLLGSVRASNPGASSEAIYRQVLELYGLVRMTVQTKKRFEEAAGGSGRTSPRQTPNQGCGRTTSR